MRLIILFIGLFSLLSFAGTNTTIHNYDGFFKADKSICFETSRPGVIWGIEKTETSSLELNEQKISKGKRRFSETFPRPSYFSCKISSTQAWFTCAAGSKINLFLIYHSSLALLQLFLQ